MKNKDFTEDIAEVKDDLSTINTEIEVLQATLTEKLKHKATLEYFLSTIDSE